MDLIIGLIFGIIFLSFAFFTRGVKSFSNFSIGDKNIPFFLLFASVSATFIGPGYSLGFIREGYESGMIFFLFAGAYGLQTILVGIFLAPELQKMQNTFSIGEVVGNKHGKIAHLLTGLISFGLLIAFSTVMAKTGGNIINEFVGVEGIIGVAILTFIVTIYSFYGGINATILTDTFQFILFIILFPLLLILIGVNSDFSFSNLMEKTVALSTSGFEEITFIGGLGLFVSFALGETLVPPYINRALGAKSAAISRKAFIFSGLFFFIWLLLMLMIGVSGTFVLNEAPSDNIGLILGQEYYISGLYGIFFVAMIGIIMSTQDSLINSGATVFTKDIYTAFLNLNNTKTKVEISDSKALKLSRLATLIIGICATIFAVYVPSVLSGLLFCYSIWAPSMLTILVASILLKQHSKSAGISSMLIGIIVSTTISFSGIESNIATLWGVIASISTYAITHYVTFNFFRNPS